MADDYIGHLPLGDIRRPERAKQFVSTLRAGFPDLQTTVEEQVAEGDKVATRWTCRGTQDGEFQGVPPTGKRVTISGLTIMRIANDKIVEEWANPDLLGMMQQIGAVPVAEAVR